jgi:hypothetical protein
MIALRSHGRSPHGDSYVSDWLRTAPEVFSEADTQPPAPPRVRSRKILSLNTWAGLSPWFEKCNKKNAEAAMTLFNQRSRVFAGRPSRVMKRPLCVRYAVHNAENQANRRTRANPGSLHQIQENFTARSSAPPSVFWIDAGFHAKPAPQPPQHALRSMLR